ncbi:hypothetical protein BDV27DRAFT_35490 [Aspergillus caelatus]|uniref:Uncharacterized protein n=1 Tax=Aspergillus caelatus TaxID=61420 RepID=A0A5N7AL47_9EURO|nr:uncharacterized protein BDV27DRAFT_35490 [Aspergillus caelatus]KAE8370612.1 hypothetical protein BDV27DRAFT_35490 [Aspergillus caelatus]
MSLYEKCPDPPPKTPAKPILLPEAFRVCALYGLAGTGIYMVFYFLRLVVFLSSVEELPVAYQKADSDTRLGPIALPDDEDSRWAIPPPLRPVSRGAIAREFIASKLYGAFSIGRELFLYGPNDNGLVTASLSTCVAQLRYMSGQSFWMLRAAGTHVIWWVCVRRFLVGVCGTGLWVIIYFPVWLSGADSKSPFVCDTILCSTTILSDLLVSIWMRGNFVDHSL